MKELRLKNVAIDENIITSVISSNGIGKSNMARSINKKLNNSILLTSNIKNDVNAENVEEYIILSLKNTNYRKINIEEIKKICKYLGIDYLLNYAVETLSSGEKQIVQLVPVLINPSEIIILDDALSLVCNLQKNKIFKKLKDKTVLHFTNNMEDLVYGTKVIVLNDKDIIFNDRTENLINKEKDIKKDNLDLPFMLKLSLNLKYYNLIDRPILNMNTMVNKLWK